MKLLKYKVTNFRSVKDSGWISCDDVTTLVGINEAGKSNLLLALWKLNPAFGGKIDTLHDLPVDRLAELRDKVEDVCFIKAEFKISDETAMIIGTEVGCDASGLKNVTISRHYNNKLYVDLHGIKPTSTLTEEISSKDENGNSVTQVVSKEYDEQTLINTIVKYMPKFVYYSNYGNLSTRIYLPNVVKWLNNETVPGIDINEDQVRTLRVLFKFVNLEPKEILNLGKDTAADRRRNGQNPSQGEIDKVDESKEERSILLQSASTKLTKEFREWWKQGEYKFRFEADGDYFRIWVSDSVRPAEVSLELRSTGLQWFLSFYLIFLVESQDVHKNAILLLDEAGLTLHPLAQKDLAKFFNKLSQTNQIINTTHSPFIVDTNNIDRCKVVYVDENGLTVASDNLRQSSDKLNEKSIYAVHAALGLSVSDILLQGCKPVIVEGPSDQIYLNTIKQILISNKAISPKDEIVFVPSGGVRGVKGVVSIISGKNAELPFVIIDSDKSGEDCKKRLIDSLYKEDKKKILEVKDFCKIENSEIEDLILCDDMIKAVDRIMSRSSVEDYFSDIYEQGKPIVSQIESFAKTQNVELTDGWKVELAKKVKVIMLKNTYDKNKMKVWKALFDKLCK